MGNSNSCRGGTGTAEIVFFDLETTVPNKTGQRFWVLEFGAIVVCPRKLVELESFSTLIRPGDLSAVGLRSSRSDGITRERVENAPLFEQVADKIFNILNGRIWAGHNIQRFDCVRIKEAFSEIGRPAPTPLGMIDSLGVLTDKFGKRAGNMKMATLAAYFGIGQQKHRSLDDVRMNLEVLKHCATVLFLEASLPSVLNNRDWRASAPTMMTRSRSNNISNRKLACRDHQETSRKSPPASSANNGSYQRSVPYARMTERVKDMILCKARGNQPLINNVLKHSHSLLR
ncbi:hypothetical protein FNV43_RR19311 [Rhamnella rubrinervis]|uniref:Exonuclease domain-containing protein n=1 Tax=Rhamnella rubrinervis TaxID=2594499 RepID=A0A8K0GY82_9ROSA|nr:hypothetical protein FNV43_RR19311 [Rhamnella rubrinervis]